MFQGFCKTIPVFQKTILMVGYEFPEIGWRIMLEIKIKKDFAAFVSTESTISLERLD